MKKTIMAGSLLVCAGTALGQFSLSQYSLQATYPLPLPSASEASAVSYNPDTGTLFVLGDEGDALAEVSLQGQLLTSMTLTGFDDTEGLAYLGGGRFAITEERLQNAYRFTYSAGGSVSRASLPVVDLGPTVGNVGIEGIAYEASTNTFFTVKEKTPQAVRSGTIDFDAGTASMPDLFAPNLGVLDLSDIALLSSVPELVGTPSAQSLLIYSQESQRLLEVSRTGTVLSSFDLTGVTDAEGVTVGPDGTIYIVGEAPALYVLVPGPGTAGMLVLGGLALGRRRR
jgi:hypothetical protein